MGERAGRGFPYYFSLMVFNADSAELKELHSVSIACHFE